MATVVHGTKANGQIASVRVDDDGHVKISGTINADLLNVEDVTVRGSDAAGTAPTQAPVLIAGSDGAAVRTMALTPTGLVKVEISDVTEGPPLLTEGVIDPGEDTVANSVKPLLIGAKDPTNLLRSVRSAADGTLRVDPTGTTTQPTLQLNALIPVAYDYVSLTYTVNDLTGVVFKTGGAGGTTVATLTLAYSGGILQSVTRS